MGKNWENCSNPLFSSSTVSYLVVDNDDNVFIATSAGLFRSSDYGQNWVEMLTGGGGSSFQSVAVGENGLTLASSFRTPFLMRRLTRFLTVPSETFTVRAIALKDLRASSWSSQIILLSRASILPSIFV